jgi:hypothetical protein
MLGGDIGEGMYRKAMSTHIAVGHAEIRWDARAGNKLPHLLARGDDWLVNEPRAYFGRKCILLHLGNWSVMLRRAKIGYLNGPGGNNTVS